MVAEPHGGHMVVKQSMIRKPRLKYRVQVTVKVKVYCGKTVNDKETQVKIKDSSNSKSKGRLC